MRFSNCVFSDDPLGPTNATFYFDDEVALETTVANRKIESICRVETDVNEFNLAEHQITRAQPIRMNGETRNNYICYISYSNAALRLAATDKSHL